MTIDNIRDSSWEEMEEAVPEQAGKRQVRIGLFAISGLIASLVLLFWLTDPSMFRGRYTVTTSVDNVMGLLKGDPVQMRGVTIGRVQGFEMGDQGEDVVVTLEIEGEWPIPEGSTTQLVSPGLMDPKTVEVLPGPGPGTIGRGTNMPGIAVRGLLDDTETLGEKGQVALDRITELLSDKNLGAIGGSVEGIDDLVHELSDLVESEGENLAELIQAFRVAADGLADMTVDGADLREDLASLLAKGDSAMGRIYTTSETIEGVASSLETILTRIENGQGTLGQLSVNDSLFTSLLAAAESARLLLDDIREDPDRYLPGVSIF